MTHNATASRIMNNRKKYNEIKERLLGILPADGREALSESQLSGRLQLRGHARKSFRALLDLMVERGDIVRVGHDRYSAGKPGDLIAGRLDILRSGNGFVAPEDGSTEIFIDKTGMNTSLPGDRVLVRLNGSQDQARGERRTGKIVRVLERSRRAIAGTLKKTKNFYYVVPIDPTYTESFYVPDKKDAEVGDRVVIQFTEWDHKHVSPEAEIIERIGPANDPSLDTLAILRHYGLSESLPADVVREASEAPERMAHPGRRDDFRDLFTFTIDPATARDFDDALSMETDDKGRRVLGVHIADVSHFVPQNCAMDAEAKKRGNSVYLPDLVLPMLPEQLSNGLCSLRPNEDRLAFSALLTFDEKGTCLRSSFHRSIIRSRLRLNYEQALAALESGSVEGYPEAGISAAALSTMRGIHQLAQQLRARRFDRYCALDLDMPEYEVVMGADGMISDIRKNVNDISHQLIEECMVAANEAVDKALSERGIELLRRVHAEPSPAKIELLAAQLTEMGFQPGDLSNRRNLSAFLKSVRGHPLEHDVKLVVLKSMMRAEYSPDPIGHYGLAKQFYAHFTSPIRRYPDLVVHRILAAMLVGKRTSYSYSSLKAIGSHCSKTEQVAENAEKMLLEIKKYRFLEQQLKTGRRKEYDAIIVNVRRFGMFVELVELGVQGLVPITSLSAGYVRFSEETRSLRTDSAKYSVLDRVKVRVSRVDFDKRQVDFEVSGTMGGRASRAGGRIHRRSAAGKHTGRPKRGG